MTCGSKLRLLSVLAFVVMAGIAVAKTPHPRPMKARARFLATSTLVRGTWGLNQDTYLAELLLSSGGEPLLVRVIDEYPNAYPPLRVEVLTSQPGQVLKVIRDSNCDLPYANMLLRTAPGDPMALVRARLSYQPQLDKVPEPGTLLPCYRIVRRK